MSQIRCPHCEQSFEVEEALSGRLEEDFRRKYASKWEEQNKQFQKERAGLDRERETFRKEREEEQKRVEAKVREGLELRLGEEKKKIEGRSREEFLLKIRSLEEENQKRKQENFKLKEQELNLLKKEKELNEREETRALELEKKLLEQRKVVEDRVREETQKRESEKFELEKVRLLKQISDNKKLAEEMKRKAEQGSMQLQGEVQELALEELLKTAYPFDRIEEVPKGMRGADVLQTVVNASRQDCGRIVYESKRTRNFSAEWIEKLKEDQLRCKAAVAMIVTQTLPRDMERFGEKDGVWICRYAEVKSLSLALREMLIRVRGAERSQENKGEKMELLYRYLTGEEFIRHVQRIVENYDNMSRELDKEKRAVQKLWKQREKQIWAVQENLSSLFGSIKGIAGSALEAGDLLELPGGEEGDEAGAEKEKEQASGSASGPKPVSAEDGSLF